MSTDDRPWDHIDEPAEDQPTEFIRVVCKEPSHNGREAFIYVWMVLDGADAPVGAIDTRTHDKEVLVAGRPVDRRDVYGTSTKPPTLNVDTASVQDRTAITCPLCGLRVEMREETAKRVAATLYTNGVFRITLRALAAIL